MMVTFTRETRVTDGGEIVISGLDLPPGTKVQVSIAVRVPTVAQTPEQMFVERLRLAGALVEGKPSNALPMTSEEIYALSDGVKPKKSLLEYIHEDRGER